MPRIAALDRAPGFWLAVVADDPADPGFRFLSLPDLRRILDWMREEGISHVAIDVPIGLPEVEERPVDKEARRFLGPRRASVFPVPNRAVFPCATWSEANEVSNRTRGKGISQQAFGILPGIREVDGWITPALQDRVHEVHPEVCFRALHGAPMEYPKRDRCGVADRLAVLAEHFPDPEALLQRRPPRAHDHDVLDALVGLVTAHRASTGEAGRLGGERDARGLRMEMVY